MDLNPNGATVIPLDRRRGNVAATPREPVSPPATFPAVDPAVRLFDVPPEGPQRPRSAKPGRSPEHARALEIAALYKAKQPVCDSRHAARAILAAIKAGTWADEAIVAAVERLGDTGWSLTPNTLNIELRKGAAAQRQVDPVIHQAIDAAMEHLGRLEREQMTATEQALAAALRQVCVAVMRTARPINPTAGES